MTICKRSARHLSIALIPAAIVLLSGCGAGRDSALAEKLARAERAAERAETAQKAAERAASAASAKLEQINAASEPGTAAVEEPEIEDPVDTAGAEIGPPDPA